MMSDRNGISPPKARTQVINAGIRLALMASFVWVLLSGSAFGLGLVEYYGQKVVYVPLNEIGSPHYWSFELQNNGENPVDVAILVESPLIYLESQMVTVAPFSSKKMTFTIMLPDDIHYAVGDFADVPFEVAYVDKATAKNVVLKKGIRGWMAIVVGQQNQVGTNDIHAVLKATGQPMTSFRYADNELGAGFYEPAVVTSFPVPPKPEPVSSGNDGAVFFIAGALIVIMCAACLMFVRWKRSANQSFRHGVGYISILLPFLFAFIVMPNVLADSGSGYDVSAEILEEMPMTQMLTSVGYGISGFLTGITQPVTVFILAIGVVFVVLALVYFFGGAIKSFLGAKY